MSLLNEKLIVYENGETEFKSFGVSVVNDAYDIVIKQVMNGEYSLTFSLPKNSNSYKEIKVGRFIKAYDTVFVVRSFEEYSQPPLLEVEVFCEHIMFELIDEFIPLLTHQNSTPHYILTRILNGTRFKPNAPTKGGYSLQVTRGTKLKCLDELCENIGGIRIPAPLPDSNGLFEIKVIPDEGVDKGVLVHNRKNMSSIKRIVDGKNIATRLYVYGEEGLGIEKADGSGGKAYIDADNIGDYPKPKEVAISFDTINEVNSLYEAGLKYLQTAKKPAISYQVEMEALRTLVKPTVKDVEIGDVLTVVDEELGITIKAKVTELTWTPEKGNMTVSLEAVMSTADKVIADILGSQETETGIRRGNVWTEWLTVPFILEPTNVYFSQEYKTKPVINVQFYGNDEPIHAKIELIQQVTNGIDVFTGLIITPKLPENSTATATDIAIQSIGRI